MKSSIDLTTNRDFDPKKFKVRKVRSRYFNNSSDKEGRRVPWEKDGTPFDKHVISRLFDDIVFTTTWEGLNVTSTFHTRINDYQILSSDADFLTLTSANVFDMYNMTDWSATNTYSFTSSYTNKCMNAWTNLALNTSYTEKRLNNFPYGGFRTGKVSKMKEYKAKSEVKFESRKETVPWYKDEDRWTDPKKKDELKDYKRRLQANGFFSIKYRGNGHIFSSYQRYEGYEPPFYYEDINVESYRYHKENAHNRLWYVRGDWPIADILDMSTSHKKPKNLLINEDTRKIQWPDFHSDYLRELQGLEPRNDWRHGIELPHQFDEMIIA